MKRIRTEHARADGWTRWVKPVMKNYKMACCDCGLVHTLDFRVVEVTNEDANGSLRFSPVVARRFQVQFRARRDEFYTKRQRKQHGKKQASNPPTSSASKAGNEVREKGKAKAPRKVR